jgi:hypothetical protein
MNPQNPSSKNKVRTGMLIGKATIFGTDWCGYTTKQKQAFDEKGIEYDFINCEDSANAEQCAGIKGYPVVKGYPNAGDSWDGFKPPARPPRPLNR